VVAYCSDVGSSSLLSLVRVYHDTALAERTISRLRADAVDIVKAGSRPDSTINTWLSSGTDLGLYSCLLRAFANAACVVLACLLQQTEQTWTTI